MLDHLLKTDLPFIEDLSFLTSIGLCDSDIFDHKSESQETEAGLDEVVDNEINNVVINIVTDTACSSPSPRPLKRRRRTYARGHKELSPWWITFLHPQKREAYVSDADGREATLFRRIFRVRYHFFKEKVLEECASRWWPFWHDRQVDAYNKPVASLELKLLGVLCTLSNSTSHLLVSLQTYLSEETHRSFFLDFVSKMSNIKAEYIFMPRNDDEYKFVEGEYSSIGFPGCVGSVDVVHVGWNKCPVQYTNIYKGKEGYPTIAYEVICSSKKFIQSVTYGHPGSRNDKHIVRYDDTVNNLL